MKYGFGDFPLEDTVEKYVKLEDSIEVYMLNGDKIIFDLTEEDEQMIIDLMLEEARMRDSDYSLVVSVMKMKRRALTNVISYLLCFALEVLMAIIVDSNNGKFVFSVLSGIYGVRVIHNGREYKYRKEELAELRKYNLYLSMIDDVEKYRDCGWLYTGVEGKENLNINTIDNFSLKNIGRIRANILLHESLGKMENDFKEQYVDDEFMSLMMQKEKNKTKKLKRKINKK